MIVPPSPRNLIRKERLGMHATEQEKDHFNDLSSERRKHGFIPDLEGMQDSDYFYLSPFRRRALAKLALRRSSRFLVNSLASRLPRGVKVLDLGCGSGWFSLELARAGFHVTSVDLSEASIELARQTLQGADLSAAGGSVTYHAADLNTWEIDHPDYAAVSYVGVLHHLEHPAALVRRMHAALPPNHFMIAQEPFPQNYGDVEAAIALLIRGLLSAAGSWYETLPLPTSADEVGALLDDVKAEYANWADKAERRQSPMNNSSDGEVNLRLLQECYEFLGQQDTLPLQQRLIGGIRLGSDEQNLAVSTFLTQIEEILVSRGVLKAGGRNVWGVAKRG
jgi:2-polyprenyl-3-methyl-5-hydroxy-6-metoxy-1,4-benzoquinol methylase